jgi:lipopolysaccharide/colanic/teichoic acid biosynthesis glycosyltransferase
MSSAETNNFTYPLRSTTVGRITKRVVDVLGSIGGLILVAPVAAAICLWIKRDSPGPVLYKRRLIGYMGRSFTAYKFRTMVLDAHEQLLADPNLFNEYRENLKLANDPRITRFGHFLRQSSLDELPQLINVLRGEMSLVGPRMLGDVELERYGSDRDAVLSCRPGITGLWQVSGRHATSFERRKELDIAYVNGWSFWLDIKILAKTLPVVVRGTGAS